MFAGFLTFLAPRLRVLASDMAEAGGRRSVLQTSGLQTQQCAIHDIYECHNDQIQGNYKVGWPQPSSGS